MLMITEKADNSRQHHTVLCLPFEQRQKARLKAVLEDGRDVGLQLQRGKILRHGDKLQAQDGTVILVEAAAEMVSTINTGDRRLLARVCYHLGNRHVPLQVEANWCRYLHDHVLDDMVSLLGADVEVGMAPFEPEAGAYAGHHSTHSHSQ